MLVLVVLAFAVKVMPVTVVAASAVMAKASTTMLFELAPSLTQTDLLPATDEPLETVIPWIGLMVMAAVEFRVVAEEVCWVAVAVFTLEVVAKVVLRAPIILLLAAVLIWVQMWPVVPMVMVPALAFDVPVLTVFRMDIPSCPLLTTDVNGPTTVLAVVLLLDRTGLDTGLV